MIISGPQALQIADTAQQLRNATERVNALIDANKKLHDRLKDIPAIALAHIEDNYGSPCDDGLAAFCDDAGLDMPNREKTVSIEWSQTVYYSAEIDVECEWDGEVYVPTDQGLDELREAALNDPHYDYDDYNEEVRLVD